MARPTGGMKLLAGFSASDEAKERFAAIVATMTGAKSVLDVCGELGVCEARFHAMRKEFLGSALGLLERRPVGRKPSGGGESPEASRLRDEIEKLRLELAAAQIKAEMAMVMPHVLKRPESPKKTKGRKRSL